MRSIESNENLELWALAALVMLWKRIARVVKCQSSTANLKLWDWSCGSRCAVLASALAITGSNIIVFILVQVKGNILYFVGI